MGGGLAPAGLGHAFYGSDGASATEIALKHLGRPLPNAVLLGGFAALSGLITLEAVSHAIRDKFSGKVADGNIAAAAEAYEYIQREMEELKPGSYTHLTLPTNYPV